MSLIANEATIPEKNRHMYYIQYDVGDNLKAVLEKVVENAEKGYDLAAVLHQLGIDFNNIPGSDK